MRTMIDEKLARFESNLERLVESAFTSFFARRVRAQDLALQLARAMQDNALPPTEVYARPIAPDIYEIHLSQPLHNQVLQQQAMLQQTLSQHMVDLAMHAGYHLRNVPSIRFTVKTDQERSNIEVTASHSTHPKNSTTSMQRVEIQDDSHKSVRAYVLINSQRVIYLTEMVMNIGRQRDNHIPIDDPYVSRHHLQIRRRFNEFILFDIHSNSGTFVNGVQVKEHHLQTGDVIQIGKTTLVFIADHPVEDEPLSQTQPLE